MKDFFQYRELAEVRQRMKGDAAGGGLSDGQDDSTTEKREQDKDYRGLMGVYDSTRNPNGPEFMVFSHLVIGYGYKPQIAAKTMIRNNPDIKSIKLNTYKNAIKTMTYHDDDPVTFDGSFRDKNW